MDTASQIDNPYEFQDDLADESCEPIERVDSQCEKFQCAHCSKLFLYKSSLKMHLKNFHSTSSLAVECTLCDFRCIDEIVYIKHIESHQKVKNFFCPNCKKSFARKYNLARHLSGSGCDGRTKSTYPCQVCGHIFNRKDNLREHLRKHVANGLSKKKFVCDICNKTVNRKWSLITHLRTHTDERLFKCQVCYESFKAKGALVKHQRKHTGEKPFSCDKCKKCFAAKETLNRHIKTHMEWKPHECAECGKTFIQQTQLRTHMYYHTGVSDLKCHYCETIFHRKASLIKHIKYVHEGAKRLDCPHEGCPKKFMDKNDLKRHLSVHTVERPFECKECQKTFRTNALLSAHKRTHLREIARCCPKCPRAFIRGDCLLRHMRSKHPDLYIALRIETQKNKFENIKSKLLANTSTSSTKEYNNLNELYFEETTTL